MIIIILRFILITESSKNWDTNLTVRVDYLENVKMKRGIYEGDTLSFLWFFNGLTLLCLVLVDVKAEYNLRKRKGPVNHLLFVDHLKLYALIEHEKIRNTAVNTV